MLQALVDSAMTYLQTHPVHGGIVVSLIAFAESLAIIGSLIPGSVTMTAVGVLMGSGSLPELPTLSWAIVGALIGDYVSYWFGIKYQSHIRELKIIKRYERWLDAGEGFFKKHGGKSIIIGRFFGPMRSMVPLVAGTLNMPKWHFIAAAIPSAIMWAVLYLTPGYLMGKYGMQLSYERIGHHVLTILIGLLLIWLIYMLLRQIILPIVRRLAPYFERLRLILPTVLSHPGGLIFDTQQLVIWGLSIILLGGFIDLSSYIAAHSDQIHLNKTIFVYLNAHQSAWLTPPNLVITYLGNKIVLSSVMVLATVWLSYRCCWRTAHFLLVLLLATAALTYGLKLGLQMPRPGAIHATMLPAYPSGHTTLSVSLLGFLTYLCSQQIRPCLRHWFYLKYAIVIGLIAASRLYLRAHWFSDALGGILLGLFLLFVTIALYRRKPDTQFQHARFHQIVPSLLLITWLSYTVVHFSTDITKYQGRIDPLISTSQAMNETSL